MAESKDSFLVDLIMPSLYTSSSFPVWIKTVSIFATGIVSLTSLIRYVRTLSETNYDTRFFFLLLLSLSTTFQFVTNIVPFRWNPRTALLFSNALPHLFLDFALFLNQNNPALAWRRTNLMRRRLTLTLIVFSLALLSTFLLSLVVIFQAVNILLPNPSSEGTSINNILALIICPQKTVLIAGLSMSFEMISSNNLKQRRHELIRLSLIGLCVFELYVRLHSIDLFEFGPHFVSLLWHEHEQGSAISSLWMNLADFVIFQLFSIILLLLPQKTPRIKKTFWLSPPTADHGSHSFRPSRRFP
ncbi:hypothetical protein BLNAU_21906 [Blattamonas nauphoetae]|uniref:Uncharacterized protein n=1 Tax=Blattamonas nauphoetae TaxID=2049346 RepID=A0ABQ9WUK5_9EUKA|nr:hypothetical protein BLNAU_21906 [Blattamonas nauphoetae]